MPRHIPRIKYVDLSEVHLRLETNNYNSMDDVRGMMETDIETIREEAERVERIVQFLLSEDPEWEWNAIWDIDASSDERVLVDVSRRTAVRPTSSSSLNDLFREVYGAAIRDMVLGDNPLLSEASVFAGNPVNLSMDRVYGSFSQDSDEE